MSSTFNQDKELAEFFTDVEHLRDAFKNSVAAQILPKRLLVIHGVGGVGKSSLLRMFRLHCKSVNVPVALASGDDSKSALDVLTHWTDDLKADGVAFPVFSKTFEQYRAIQAKVDEKSRSTREKATEALGKVATKTTEAMAGATIGAVAGSVIPGIGTLAGAVGGAVIGTSAEALVDWLRKFLPKPDIDLLLDPAKKLTDNFLDDIGKFAEKKRVVLMLDTFEQISALDDWTRDVAQRSHANVLFVIAGRVTPDWGKKWDGWLAQARVEELEPMSKRVMNELIYRYYATLGEGDIDPKQAQAIIEFARGLPMAVNTAVYLMRKYHLKSFHSVKAEAIEDLAGEMRKGLPKEMYPALEAAATVRWFNREILYELLKQPNIDAVYDELGRFPFVRPRIEGLALHDRIREIFADYLRIHDPQRQRELHELAATYFEKRLEKAKGEEAEQLGLERLYHRVSANEETGIKLFQEMAEELTRYRLVNRLHALLNDVNTYPLEHENSKSWREYYNARHTHLSGQPLKAEETYERIGEDAKIEPKLRAYALHDLGTTLRGRRIGKAEISKKALACFERSLVLGVLGFVQK